MQSIITVVWIETKYWPGWGEGSNLRWCLRTLSKFALSCCSPDEGTGGDWISTAIFWLATPLFFGYAWEEGGGGRSCSLDVAVMGAFVYTAVFLTSVLFFHQVALQEEEELSWKEASDPRALCNDYSRAGFFLRRNITSPKWIIFLESGSLCYSNDTCNRRFFSATVSFILHSQ